MIDVQNVSKVYEMPGESVSVLAGIEFKVKSGETAAVVGPAGSGKTTLLNGASSTFLNTPALSLTNSVTLRLMRDTKV